jgi:hypothetical protein
MSARFGGHRLPLQPLVPPESGIQKGEFQAFSFQSTRFIAPLAPWRLNVPVCAADSADKIFFAYKDVIHLSLERRDGRC